MRRRRPRIVAAQQQRAHGGSTSARSEQSRRHRRGRGKRGSAGSLVRLQERAALHFARVETRIGCTIS
jgi:hypothetical protein